MRSLARMLYFLFKSSYFEILGAVLINMIIDAETSAKEKTIEIFIKSLLKIAPIKIITLAPELEGMDKFIKELQNLNIKIQLKCKKSIKGSFF